MSDLVIGIINGKSVEELILSEIKKNSDFCNSTPESIIVSPDLSSEILKDDIHQVTCELDYLEHLTTQQKEDFGTKEKAEHINSVRKKLNIAVEEEAIIQTFLSRIYEKYNISLLEYVVNELQSYVQNDLNISGLIRQMQIISDKTPLEFYSEHLKQRREDFARLNRDLEMQVSFRKQIMEDAEKFGKLLDIPVKYL